MIGHSTVGYAVDDLESGLRHLKDLLSVICTTHFEMPAGKCDERVDSLLWMADGIAQAVYKYHITDDQEAGK